MERTVIRNAIVLSMDPTIGEHLDADVLIEREKIAAVRPNIGPVDGREIDGKDMIVMPGFVDTHRHTWQSLLRNTATDWEPGSILRRRARRHGRTLYAGRHVCREPHRRA
jgi:5-methylthioadenosine/S-adenosylhomocysteine deaminase